MGIAKDFEPAAAAPPTTELTEAIAHAHVIAVRAYDALEKLDRALERLRGPVPTADPALSQVKAEGDINVLHHTHNRLSSALSGIESALQDLQRYV